MLPKYAPTVNKEIVREADTKLIEKEASQKKRKLSYLGMPSGDMKDILAWQNLICKSTAVEIDEKKRHDLLLTAMKYDLQNNIKLLFGDIEEILLNGKDGFNNKLEFPYDLIFLDFFGTLIYEGHRRTNAITTIFEKQKGQRFLLLLTFSLKNLSGYSKHCINRVLEELRKELSVFYISDESAKARIDHILDWYNADETADMFKQKLFVPYFIKTKSEACGFKLHVYPPIFYLGFNSCPMIHFQFKLLPADTSPIKAISNQTIFDIININIKEVSDGKIIVKNKQAPMLKI